MNKIDYIRGKPVTYEWGKDEKELTLSPLTNGELIDIIEEFQDEFENLWGTDIEEDNFLNLIRQKPAYFINQVVDEEFTEDDFLDGYPNDLYNVFQAFKEVNFTFLSRLKLSGSKMIQNLTRQVQKPTKK